MGIFSRKKQATASEPAAADTVFTLYSDRARDEGARGDQAALRAALQGIRAGGVGGRR
jgi:hypothetical protein